MRFQHILEAKETLSLVDLPYKHDALEPVMGRETVKLHYDVLSRGYVDRFNKGEGDPEFNRAGAMLHNLFWPQLQPPKVNNQAKGASLELIEKIHGSFEDFRDALVEEAAKFQGSGWVYMARDGAIKTLKNQSWKNDVIMPLDIWEHAYLLDYQGGDAKRKYIRGILRCINWNVINDRLNISI
jgi:Fe-Mn family superoxide dismutase